MSNGWAYYNEHDKNAAAWLRELIKAGHIAPGEVDERSIEDVIPNELVGFTQCHFFAGIGTWSYALRQAGWSDDRPVWTGSCPCQPFSQAGKGDGVYDERHLWPSLFWLIKQCRPDVVFGEQVASKDGLAWLDIVQSDMEAEKYSIGAFDLPACGFGAPHIRQRLFFVADASRNDKRRIWQSGERNGRRELSLGGHGADCSLADAISANYRGEEQAADNEPSEADRPADRIGGRGDARKLAESEGQQHNGSGTARRGRREPTDGGAAGGLAIADSHGHRANGSGSEGKAERVSGLYRAEEPCAGESGRAGDPLCAPSQLANTNGAGRARQGQAQPEERRGDPVTVGRGTTNGFWADAEWLYCKDGKHRPTKPGIFPLAHGVAARVVKLRGIGNGICSPAAQAFIESYMESVDGML